LKSLEIRRWVLGLFWLGIGVTPHVQADIRVSESAPSSSVAFEWDSVVDADRYILWLGNSPGTRDIDARSAAGTQLVAHGLPTDGSTIHATLRARVSGTWHVIESKRFDELSQPLLESPENLVGGAAIFSWRDTPAASTRVLLMAGTAVDPDAYDLRYANYGDDFVSLDGLPVDGSDLHVTLWWREAASGLWRKERSEVFASASSSAIVSPTVGSTLLGSATNFKMEYIPGSSSSRVRIGTSSQPNLYGIWSLIGTSAPVAKLPLDSSEIVVRYEYYDQRRWVPVSTASYQAALPSYTLWGDCTPTDGLGQRSWARMRDEHTSFDWGTTSYSVVESEVPKLDRILRDNCASDTEYVIVDYLLGVPLRQTAKGVYIWLSPGSGAATLSWRPWTPVMFFPPELRALPEAGSIATPVHVPIPSHAGRLSIKPLDVNKPVKIAEIRISADTDDITALRKGRWSDEIAGDFTALNGDPRARVTAEIAREFSPDRSNDIQLFTAGFNTCGFFNWVDATWEIDQPVIISEEEFPLPPTVWVNWDLASNEDIWEAINASIVYGETYFPRFPYSTEDCTRADGSLIYQDWKSKTEAALDGTYSGPEVRYE